MQRKACSIKPQRQVDTAESAVSGRGKVLQWLNRHINQISNACLRGLVNGGAEKEKGS
jgi:hypothetical protein